MNVASKKAAVMYISVFLDAKQFSMCALTLTLELKSVFSIRMRIYFKSNTSIYPCIVLIQEMVCASSPQHCRGPPPCRVGLMYCSLSHHSNSLGFKACKKVCDLLFYN